MIGCNPSTKSTISQPTIKSKVISLESLNKHQKPLFVEPGPFRIDYQKKVSDEKVSKIQPVNDPSLNVVIEDLEEEKVVASEDFLEAID